jgi:antitoxin YefM
MYIISFSELRKNMKAVMDITKDRHEHTVITRKQGDMVMMSLEDYNSLEETTYLLTNTNNANHILSSLAEIRQGKGKVHNLIEFQS